MSGTSPVEGAAERTAAAPSTESVPPLEVPGEISFRRRGPVRRYLHRHPRVTDALVGLLYLLGVFPDVLAAPRDGIGPNLAVLIPSFLAGGVALVLLRRRRPILVTLVLACLDPLLLVYSEGLFSLGFGVLLGLYSVAVKHRAAVTFTVLVLAAVPSGVALMLLAGTAPEASPAVRWILLAMLLMMYIIAAGVGITVRRNRLHEEEVRAWAHRNAQLASVAERNRIAREMHDIIAHSLTVMIALSDGAAVVLRRDPARAGEVLTELSGTGRSALADIRRVLGVLRQDAPDPPTGSRADPGRRQQPGPRPAPAPRNPLLPGSLEALVDGFSSAGLPVTLVRAGPALPEDTAFQLTVHRIVQESLTNALRYARGASRVEVRIERTGQAVRISVSDDGPGGAGRASQEQQPTSRTGEGSEDPGSRIGSGQGLHGMRERAAIYGGTVEAGPLPGGGWRTTAVLTAPVPDPVSGAPAGTRGEAPARRALSATAGMIRAGAAPVTETAGGGARAAASEAPAEAAEPGQVPAAGRRSGPGSLDHESRRSRRTDDGDAGGGTEGEERNG